MSQPRNEGRTFRVCQIPDEVTYERAAHFLCDVSEDLGPPENIQVLSLARSIEFLDSAKGTKTATVIFKKRPRILMEDDRVWRLHYQYRGRPHIIIIDTHFLDFTVLQDAEDEERRVDCIAIPGHLSHPFGSWKQRGNASSFMWLRDRLPKNFPSLRPILYGHHIYSLQGDSFQTIRDLAHSLVARLRLLFRYSATRRPLVFVAHSLGGNILKQSLVLLAKEFEPEDRHIIASVLLILCFGVPTESMAVDVLLQLFYGQIDANLLPTISADLPYLALLEEQFSERTLRNMKNIRVVSLYETERSPTVQRSPSGTLSRSGDFEILVDQRSAIQPESRPSDVIPIHENHFNLIKFSEDDDSYKKIVSYIAEVFTRKMEAEFFHSPTENTTLQKPRNRTEVASTLDPTVEEAEREKLRSRAVDDQYLGTSNIKTAQPRRPRNRSDFEIAIICALQVEADTCIALFDGFWDDDDPDPYGKSVGDPNAYTTGWIGKHSVVLAHMPSMGPAAAATIAGAFRISYPAIRLGLVVGICGGVPGGGGDEDEIFLGDVVISTSIVNYTFGRQFPNRINRKDTLDDNLGRSNIEIRAFTARLRSYRYLDLLTHSTIANLADLQTKPRLGNFRYPGRHQDILFESAYRHKHQDDGSCEVCARCTSSNDAVCDAALKSSCSEVGCHANKIVKRERPEQSAASGPSRNEEGPGIDHDGAPQIHFGRIASGDLVMKSGNHRDDIAAEEGVIAFEMEGAGVWDNFPTIVIKGVCDYADSHKNKRWQGYAAACAAACMKALLRQWAVVDQRA